MKFYCATCRDVCYRHFRELDGGEMKCPTCGLVCKRVRAMSVIM